MTLRKWQNSWLSGVKMSVKSTSKVLQSFGISIKDE